MYSQRIVVAGLYVWAGSFHVISDSKHEVKNNASEIN